MIITNQKEMMMESENARYLFFPEPITSQSKEGPGSINNSPCVCKIGIDLSHSAIYWYVIILIWVWCDAAHLGLTQQMLEAIQQNVEQKQMIMFISINILKSSQIGDNRFFYEPDHAKPGFGHFVKFYVHPFPFF